MVRLPAGLIGTVLVASLALPAEAQPVPLPQTYSFVGTNAMFGTPQDVKVNRNGSMELIERTRPAMPGRYGELHDKLLYDFQAHTIYSMNLTTNQCTVQEYGSSFFVMVVAAAEAAVGLAIILTVFKNRQTLEIDEVSSLKN